MYNTALNYVEWDDIVEPDDNTKYKPGPIPVDVYHGILSVAKNSTRVFRLYGLQVPKGHFFDLPNRYEVKEKREKHNGPIKTTRVKQYEY